MADFFGFNNLLQTLGFRTTPVRIYDDFTARASAGATSVTPGASASGGTNTTTPVKTFDEYLTEAKDATKDLTLDEFKDYVNRMLAQLQADNAQRSDLSATTLQNQMQLSNLYASLLQNSLLTGDLTGQTTSENGDAALSMLSVSNLLTPALSALNATSLNGTSLNADTYTAIANAASNAQQIRPTASSDGALTASLAASLMNLNSTTN